jgi:excisionase family DNA binding protein
VSEVVERRRRDDDLWDALDVARFLKTSRSWVYMRVERNEIPHLRVGGLIRFDGASVREWARSGLAAVAR